MKTVITNSYIMSDSHITVHFADGFTATVYSGTENFPLLCAAVNFGDWDRARDLAEPAEAVRTAIDGIEGCEVRIADGIVFYKDDAVHNTLTDRMLSMLSQGFDVKPLMLFLDNLMENESFRAIKELYGFLEVSNLPITEDGHFLAYKRVRDDYTDCHTGELDNSIGATVEMERRSVDDDKDNTCSSGLHFCARGYLDSFGGARTVVVKINPKDVVSIPSDYSNMKGRCCKYIVVQELENESPVEIEGDLDTSTSIGPMVLQLEDGDVIEAYDTVEEAAELTGIDKAYISRVLRGDRESTGGYGWKYEVRVMTPEPYTDDEYDEIEDEGYDED